MKYLYLKKIKTGQRRNRLCDLESKSFGKVYALLLGSKMRI